MNTEQDNVRERLQTVENEVNRLRSLDHAVIIAGLMGRLDAHERVCIERWGEAKKIMGGLEVSVRKLYDRWWWVAMSLIGLLVTTIASLTAMVLSLLRMQMQ